MRRTSPPRFEPWHTFVTIFAMAIAVQLLSGLLSYVGSHGNKLSGVEWSASGGLLLLGMLAILFLTRELLRQINLLLLARREARVKSLRRHIR